MSPIQTVGCMLVMLAFGGPLGWLFTRGSVEAAEVRARAFKQVAESERQHGHELAAEAAALEKMLAQQAFTIQQQEAQITSLKEGVCAKNAELSAAQGRIDDLTQSKALLCRVRDNRGRFARR